MKKAQSYTLEALNVIMEIVRDENAPINTRLNASYKILELGQNMNDKDVILKKLDILEGKIKENEKK